MHTKQHIQSKRCDSMVKLSKKLSWLLRHGAVKEGLTIKPNGFINVEDILQHPNYETCYNLEILKKIVEYDPKQRYTMKHSEDTQGYEIRANQGHTMSEVEDDKCFKLIQFKDEVPLAVHGTYLKHWPAIKREGLKRMFRNHVHFATSDAKTKNISGFRSDCEILIYLNVQKVIESVDLKLYRSHNNVILCSGMLDGSIPTKYFEKVVERHTGKLLHF